MKKRIGFPLFLVAILALVTVCGYFRVHPRDFDEIQETDVLRVVTDSVAISTFQYDLLNAFADSLGIEPKITIENDLAKNIEDLNRGDYDLIMKLLPTTSELKHEVNFSQPLLKSYLVLVQQKSAKPLRSASELEGKNIFLPKHAPEALILRHIREELGVNFELNFIENVDTKQLAISISVGEISFTVADAFTANALQKQIPNLDVATQLGFSQAHAWAFPKKSTELQEQFDAWLPANNPQK